MILVVLLILLMAGGFVSWILGQWSRVSARWAALVTVVAAFVILVVFWACHGARVDLTAAGGWLVSFDRPWIPQLGISFHLGMDGLSLVMGVLTLFLGAVSLLGDWRNDYQHPGFFYFNFLWLLAGILGVFFALDLILLYFFWEVMLVPMYFILIGWGHEHRRYAGTKFFLFTQLSGLAMLVAIAGLYFIHGRATGDYSFDYAVLLGTSVSGRTAFWLMAGFLIAFVVKLPIVPFHSWLPDAYAEAPNSGTVILAALMSKTGAYGILRFVIPLFPEAAHRFGFWGMLLGVVGILYGAKLAYAQSDLKRLIAYSSLSHMGFIMVGAFSFSVLAYQGVVMQMVAHALSIAGLFLLSEAVFSRIGSFDMNRMGRFWETMPRMGGMTVVLVMASLGLPGLANFVAEFLVLAGAWQVHLVLSVLASVGLISSVIYSLVILQKVFHERESRLKGTRDLSPRELLVSGLIIVAILWLGLFPSPVIHAAGPAVQHIVSIVNTAVK